MVKKTGHILLVFLLLITTMGMTVDFHFCHHQLYDLSFFGEAENCCLPDVQSNPHKHDHCTIDDQASNDCEDEFIQVKAVDNYITSSYNVISDDIPVRLLMSRTVLIPDLFSYSATNPVYYTIHDLAPPLVKTSLSFKLVYLL